MRWRTECRGRCQLDGFTMSGRVDSCDTHVTATAAHPECLGPCRSVSLTARSEILPLQAQRQVALEAHPGPAGDPSRFAGSSPAPVGQRVHLALVTVAPDMAGYSGPLRLPSLARCYGGVCRKR